MSFLETVVIPVIIGLFLWWFGQWYEKNKQKQNQDDIDETIKNLKSTLLTQIKNNE